MKHLLLLLFSLSAFAQKSDIEYKGEIINTLDANNHKTGIWKCYDETSNLVAVGEYKNDSLVSPTKYYRDNKLIFAIHGEYCTIYKEKDTIQAKFARSEDGKVIFIDEKGNSLPLELSKYVLQNTSIRPVYYGGASALAGYMKNNINKKNTGGTKGKVTVLFTLDRNGYVEKTEITKSSDTVLNDEAIRLVKGMPRWQPGFQNGRFVRVQYTLPIVF